MGTDHIRRKISIEKNYTPRNLKTLLILMYLYKIHKNTIGLKNKIESLKRKEHPYKKGIKEMERNLKELEKGTSIKDFNKKSGYNTKLITELLKTLVEMNFVKKEEFFDGYQTNRFYWIRNEGIKEVEEKEIEEHLKVLEIIKFTRHK